MNILITTIGQTPIFYIYFFKEALKNKGKIFVANSKKVVAMSHADGFTITPSYYDSSYISYLISYCKENNIKAIISLIDMDVLVLAKNKELFNQHGITVVLSDVSKIELCNDKWMSYKFFLSIGLKQPKTFIDINLLKKELQSGKASFPLFFKPRWGLGSFGLYQVDAFNELDIIYNKIYNEIFSSVYKHESEQDKEFCVLMQEKIKGEEHGIDILNDLNGNYVTYAAKRKLRMDGSTLMAQTIQGENFEKVAKTISLNLKHIGDLDVDFFLDEKGEITVLEMNCRFGGQYPFAHLAGADFPGQIIDWLSGNKTSEKYLMYKTGVISYKDYSLFRL